PTHDSSQIARGENVYITPRTLVAYGVGALVATAALAGPAEAFSTTSTPSTAAATAPRSPTTVSTKVATTPTSVAGTWTGRVTETGRASPFAITLTVDAKGGSGTTDYPDQSCSGKLTRVGTSANYVFYSE